MRDTLLRAMGAAAVVALVSACTTVDAAPDGVAPPVNVVVVTAGDYFFQMPDTLPAGMTSFRLMNKGPELHHIQAVRLDSGRTLEDLLKHMASAPTLPAWATEVGGPNAPAPGEVTETALDLQPGSYAILCVIPSPDGTPHVMKGMMKQVTVVPVTSGASDAAPATDASIVLDDYSFDVTPALTAGRHSIRVENRASQSHEVFLVQLAPGKTVQDVVAWVESPAGPPPGRPIGGTTGIARGMVNYVTVDLTAGEYALLCFVPDAKDGKPHVAHGMVRQISVK